MYENLVYLKVGGGLRMDALIAPTRNTSVNNDLSI
jgi:hypothetical protein